MTSDDYQYLRRMAIDNQHDVSRILKVLIIDEDHPDRLSLVQRVDQLSERVLRLETGFRKMSSTHLLLIGTLILFLTAMTFFSVVMFYVVSGGV